MAELSGRVAALQMSLQLSAMREFELLGTGEDKPNPLLLDRLRACCLVIDVLGFKARPPAVLCRISRIRFWLHCSQPWHGYMPWRRLGPACLLRRMRFKAYLHGVFAWS